MFKRTVFHGLGLSLLVLTLAAGCEDEKAGNETEPSAEGDAGGDAPRDGASSTVGDAAGSSVSRDAAAAADGGDIDAATAREDAASSRSDAQTSTSDLDASAADAARTDAASDAGAVADAKVDAGSDASASDAAVDAGDASSDAGDASSDAGDARADAGDAGSDAAPADGGTDSGEPVCIEQGANCDRGSCCDGLSCVPEGDTGRHLCDVPCDVEERRCSECGPYCGAALNGTGRCDEAFLIAHDGTFLGVASSRLNTREGVCSQTDPYGTGQHLNSIYRQYGTYGKMSSSPQSAYNVNAVSPPAIVCVERNQVIGRVTKSTNLTFNPVDPDELCDWLRDRNM